MRWLCVEKMLCFCFCSFCLYRNYMNDTLRTNVFVRFQAETIACACIFLAARALQVRGPLFHPPMNAYYVDASTSAHSTSAASNVWTFCAFFPQIPLPSRPHWYLLFGATDDEVKEICVTTLRLYTRKKVGFGWVFLSSALLDSTQLKYSDTFH